MQACGTHTYLILRLIDIFLPTGWIGCYKHLKRVVRNLHKYFIQAKMLSFFLESGDSRPILRRLDRVIGLPEEGALMLRDYEHALFGHTSIQHLLKGLVKPLGTAQTTKRPEERTESKDAAHFQQIVSHFYLVSLQKWLLLCALVTLLLPGDRMGSSTYHLQGEPTGTTRLVVMRSEADAKFLEHWQL